MQNSSHISVLLLTGYSPRSEIISQRVSVVFNGEIELKTIESPQKALNLKPFTPQFIFIDLANIKYPAAETVQSIKKTFNTSKIIAIHIYYSGMLIDPLFEWGIDGYLTYEPSIEQIKDAVDKIRNGVKYVPEHLEYKYKSLSG